MARAREWSFRNQLEAQQHERSCWVTLTYEDEQLPQFGTLEKPHLSGWLKRLRYRLDRESKTRIRFFGCGEYGETTGRAHYHCILYGTREHPAIQETWPYGHARADPLTPEAISYVAGYAAKKIGWKQEYQRVIDPETGELLHERAAPFVLMSRNPGIGANAKRHWKSWRHEAVWDGHRLPVPRYLHEAWRTNATDQQLQALVREKLERALSRDTTKQQLSIDKRYAEQRQQEQQRKRRKL